MSLQMQQEKKSIIREIILQPKLKLGDITKLKSQCIKQKLAQSTDDSVAFQASHPKLDDKVLGSGRESGFITSISLAYAQHIPLELSPDDIWLVICQGLCSHILNNAEELKKHFIDFQGKKTLVVLCDEFVKGRSDNDWGFYFSETSTQIRENIGEQAYNVLVPEFSTTTRIQKLLYQTTLMASMQKYFNYVCATWCGIPKVRLRGTPQDWKNLRTKTKELSKYNLDWWISKLLPIIDKIVAAAVDGEEDSHFWNSVYKVVEIKMSGSQPKVNGWITNFFPYFGKSQNKSLRDLDQVLKTMKQFDMKGEINKEKYHKLYPPLKSLPNGLTSTPFTWLYLSEVIKMKLVSGFVGAQITDDGYIKPCLGWAVGEEQESRFEKQEKQRKQRMKKIKKH